MFKHLFEPLKINGKTLKNRLVVSPMVTDFCNHDGTATERYLAYHEEKAKGGWGLIITEDYNVTPEGRGFSATAGLWNDDQIKSHTQLPERVHKYGAIILAQIYHCGRQTTTEAIPDGYNIRSTSALMSPFGNEIPKPFTTEEVKALVQRYGDAALRARKCGFDGVEIHAAHGYLVGQFLSPNMNKRLDQYGGNFWNRTRFAREIVEDIRKKCGSDFIIDMRLSADEFVEGGLNIEDTKAIAIMMEKTGVDMFHISVGNHTSVDYNVASNHHAHGWFTDWAEQVKQVVSVPIITVSRINDPFLADSILASDKADLIAMGRASLVDPAMPNKAKEGKFEDIRRYIGCNDGCIGVLFTDNPITCVLNPELGNEYEGPISEAKEKKKVAVIGAGPGGLSAAIAAAKAGHKVTVYESKEHAGGSFYYAAVPPAKGEITDFIVWQTTQCEKLGVKIKYNTKVDLEYIQKTKPEKIIVATGAKPWVPNIEGLEGNEHAFFAEEILDGKVKPGHHCVIIGGGQVGAETALFLGQLLRDVTILEMMPDIVSDAYMSVNWELKSSLAKRKVDMCVNSKVVRVKGKTVDYFDKNDKEHHLEADTIIIATGYRANDTLSQELKEVGFDVEVIGDAVKAREVGAATREGYLAGRYA